MDGRIDRIPDQPPYKEVTVPKTHPATVIGLTPDQHVERAETWLTVLGQTPQPPEIIAQMAEVHARLASRHTEPQREHMDGPARIELVRELREVRTRLKNTSNASNEAHSIAATLITKVRAVTENPNPTGWASRLRAAASEAKQALATGHPGGTSNLAAHARRELELCGQYAEDPKYSESIIAAVEAFASYYGHSGGSAMVAREQLYKLLGFETLSPLTSDPDEWIDQSEASGRPMWQNNRNPRAFSDDGGKTWWVLDDDDRPAEPGSRSWMFRKGDQYVALLPSVVGNPEAGYETVYEVGEVVDRFGYAVSEGFDLRESDDFQVGVLRDGKLVVILWMSDVVDDDPDVLAKIAGKAGLDA